MQSSDLMSFPTFVQITLQVEIVLRDMGKEMMAAAEAGRDVVLAGRKMGE